MTTLHRRPLRPLVMVDWGTSSLRAAFATNDQVEQTRHSDQGILKVSAGEFPRTLHELCGDWLEVPNALCLISGMAGSAQGWSLAPYCPCPAGQRAAGIERTDLFVALPEERGPPGPGVHGRAGRRVGRVEDREQHVRSRDTEPDDQGTG